MASKDFLTRLEEVAVWYDFNLPTVTDVVKRQQFQEKTISNFFDLFAMLANEIRTLKDIHVPLERPNWQPLGITTFIEKKIANPEDKELGLRGN